MALEPCPHCGSPLVARDGAHIACGICGVRGPKDLPDMPAEQAWNALPRNSSSEVIDIARDLRRENDILRAVAEELAGRLARSNRLIKMDHPTGRASSTITQNAIALSRAREAGIKAPGDE